jgi:hypothetical protein
MMVFMPDQFAEPELPPVALDLQAPEPPLLEPPLLEPPLLEPPLLEPPLLEPPLLEPPLLEPPLPEEPPVPEPGSAGQPATAQRNATNVEFRTRTGRDLSFMNSDGGDLRVDLPLLCPSDGATGALEGTGHSKMREAALKFREAPRIRRDLRS